MSDIHELDRQLHELPGREKLKALLKARGFTLSGFAERYNLWVENVSRCLSGQRALPEVRDALARELEVSRETIDLMIDGGEDEEE